jgi:hypothetical protein
MPNLPVPTQTDIAIQNAATGQVDYLGSQGSTLTQSALFDYGIPGWNVVGHGDFNGDGHQDLALQNPSNGAVDFVFLDANAHPIGSEMSNVPLPHIVDSGIFGGFAGGLLPGQAGNTLVSQLPNGELDFLAFNNAGQLIGSDALANTIGFAPAVAAGNSAIGDPVLPMFAGVGDGNSGNVILQLSDGSLDVVGFSGFFGRGTLSYTASDLLAGTAGTASVMAVNQDFGLRNGANVTDGTHEGVQMITQTADGHANVLYFDAGYNDASHEGAMYASCLLSVPFSGWNIVDAGVVTQQDLFRIT